MSAPFQLELSSELFPLPAVQQVIAHLSDQMAIQLLTTGDGKLVLTVNPAPSPGSVAERLLRQALTETMLAQLPKETGDTTPPVPCLHKAGREMDATLRFIKEKGELQISLVVDPTVHRAVNLLHALASLRHHARFILESTNPVDRIVIQIYPNHEGSASTVVTKIFESLSGSPIPHQQQL